MQRWVGMLFALSMVAGAACGTPEGMELKDMIDAEKSLKVYSGEFLKALETGVVGEVARAPAGLRTIEVTTTYPERRCFLVSTDASEQVLHIDTPTEREWADAEGTLSATIHPSFAEAGLDHESFLCAAVLGAKAKAFDDGLYPAVELAAEAGLGKLAARKEFLRGLLDAIPTAGEGGVDARALLAAASRLIDEPTEQPGEMTTEAEKILAAFLANETRSRPIGFYTWSLELARIFQRDRLLQTGLDESEAMALATALSKETGLLEAYEGTLRLAERLTNPFAYGDLRQAARALADGGKPNPGRPVHLFPPSRSFETELIKKLYGTRPIPEGFNLADEMVKRIRAGTLDLRPGDDSGWYDHQTFALEPLVIPEKMPEASHLTLGDSYRKDLIGLFKALLALTRETHVKQLETPTVGSAVSAGISLDLPPGLSVEPLASFYLRRGRSYRFVRTVLEEACGQEAIEKLHRQTAGGPMNLPLADELGLMESLFFGAYLTTCAELGMTPEAETNLGQGSGPAADQALFRRWVSEADNDPDLGRDIRMMVPVFYDIERQKLKVWAVLGVASKPLQASFEKRPTVRSVQEIKNGSTETIPLDKVRVTFDSEGHRLAYLVTAEVYVKKPMNREEFRAHCDRYRTEKAILENLE